jgi:TolB protein
MNLPLRRCGARLAAATMAAAAVAAATLAMAAGPAPHRQPVLQQIDLPHNYYFREMYLPQLTSGPSALAFTPDGQALVYSMQGSLWRQRLDSGVAEQLTAGPGYDYQPDVSPDGKRVVFTRYLDDALELQVLDLASGTVTALTSGRAVNCEPRWSPDGARIAWVSTAGSGHFRIHVGTFDGKELHGGPAWPERKSTTPRVYYSAFDHEISPTWSPDGHELAYVSNPEVVYGTGSIWRRSLDSGATPQLVREEETTWRARPDWAHDGKRIVYASYAGRNWHQLWATTAAPGGYPLALTYGEFDATGARWSADGRKIAYLSNSTGDLQVHVLELPGARDRVLAIDDRRYLKFVGQLALHIVGPDGAPSPARISVVAADGRAYAPADEWIHADDQFDRALTPFETHYFHTQGQSVVTLPPGLAHVTVWRGLANSVIHRDVMVEPARTVNEELRLAPLALPAGWSTSWHGADVHVHMNYAGTYRDTPGRLVRQAEGEDLDVVFDLIVNKEQRVPDISYFLPHPDPASNPAVLLSHGQEFHTGFWGHLGLLGLDDHVLLPGYAAYAHTAAASLYPTNATVADLAHAQGALVGYVHPIDHVAPDPAHDTDLTSALPVDVALGKTDYYEVVAFTNNHLANAALWHRLLNCGFRPAAAAGTDAMANFASLRGPVGMNRVYVMDDAPGATPAGTDPEARLARWLAGLKAGHSMATNSALLGFEVDGQPPGGTIEVPAGGASVHVRGFMRSIVPMDHLEVLQQGKVLRSIALHGDRRSADLDFSVKVTGPGWLLLRAWNEGSSTDVLDDSPYATTSPVYITSANAATHCGPDADYFITWIDGLANAARTHPGYNSEAERNLTLEQIAAARKVFESRR